MVVDHVAGVALQVLHLVSHHPPIQQLQQPLLDRLETELAATGAEPGEGQGVASVVYLIRLAQIVIATDVNILAPQAAIADHVGEDQNQAWLFVPSRLV